MESKSDLVNCDGDKSESLNEEESDFQELTIEEAADALVANALPAILRKRLTSFYRQWLEEWMVFKKEQKSVLDTVRSL